MRDIRQKALLQTHIRVTPLQNDGILGCLCLFIKGNEAKVVLTVKSVPEEFPNVSKRPITIDHAIKLRVHDEDHRTALDVVMTEPLVD